MQYNKKHFSAIKFVAQDPNILKMFPALGSLCVKEDRVIASDGYSVLSVISPKQPKKKDSTETPIGSVRKRFLIDRNGGNDIVLSQSDVDKILEVMDQTDSKYCTIDDIDPPTFSCSSDKRRKVRVKNELKYPKEIYSLKVPKPKKKITVSMNRLKTVIEFLQSNKSKDIISLEYLGSGQPLKIVAESSDNTNHKIEALIMSV